MSKYFSILLLAFLLMVVPSAYSQSKPDSLQLDSLGRKHKKAMRKEDGTLDAIGRYTPQSPQTASLLKYTEFPVSPATGIPNIDIPIYTIEWDGVRIPISINYHASGIKVNDVASPVGLGWVLNAGGMIGCSKNGARDDFSFMAGLGREISTATTGLGTKGNTAQGFTEYDGMHRARRSRLPAILSSSIRNVALSDIESRAVNAYTDASPYMTNGYGGNLFSVSTTGPGEKWNSASHAKKSGVDKTITQKNRYNKYNDKIETITLNAGNGDKEVAFYSYDDIGRLVSVKRSGNAGTVTNEYNIRNWLVSTASDRFKESLKYESGSETPCYNGNISRMQWQNTYDNVLRGYDFEYDGLNRLTASAYAEGTDMSQNKDRYSEYIPQYSPNGSIERLQRYGKKNNGAFGLIDDLTYQYSGNQIQSISDKTGSLLYDGSFDFKDGTNANKHKRISYVVTPNGSLQKYDPQTGKIKVLSNDMPSDSNDPDRLNENNINYISIEKTIVQKIDVNNFLYQTF